jgi:hypothetical protein
MTSTPWARRDRGHHVPYRRRSAVVVGVPAAGRGRAVSKAVGGSSRCMYHLALHLSAAVTRCRQRPFAYLAAAARTRTPVDPGTVHARPWLPLGSASRPHAASGQVGALRIRSTHACTYRWSTSASPGVAQANIQACLVGLDLCRIGYSASGLWRVSAGGFEEAEAR